MECYLLIAEERDLEHVRNYMVAKSIDIGRMNVLSINSFVKGGVFPSVIFIVKYDSSNEIHNSLARENHSHGGFNVAILGDDDPYTIDRYMGELDPVKLNILIKFYKNELLKKEAATKTESEKVEESKFLKSTFKQPAKENANRIITINSTKGGVGKSFLVFNLGYIAAKIKKEGKRIILVDYNLSEGSLSRYFSESTKTSNRIDGLVDYYLNYGKIDKAYLKDVIVEDPHISSSGELISGLDILFAPDNFSITPKKIGLHADFTPLLFELLKEMYDVVIVDTSNEKNMPANEFLIRNSNKVLFVITPNPSSIIQVKEYIEEIGIPKENYDIIYNDYNRISERFEIDKVVAGMFRIDPKTKGYSEQLDELKNDKFFVVDSDMGIRRADHFWDTIFNRKMRYVSLPDLEKYMRLFYKILKNNCGSSVIDFEDNKVTLGFRQKLMNLFKFDKES